MYLTGFRKERVKANKKSMNNQLFHADENINFQNAMNKQRLSLVDETVRWILYAKMSRRENQVKKNGGEKMNKRNVTFYNKTRYIHALKKNNIMSWRWKLTKGKTKDKWIGHSY
jgi:hypothetical protein